MDKNTITGFVLIALVIFGFSWYSRPSKEEIEQMAKQDSLALVQKEQEEAMALERQNQEQIQRNESAKDSSAIFFAQRNGEEQKIVLQNEKLKLTLNNCGACVEEAEIIGYKSRRRDGNVVILDKENASMQFALTGKEENLYSRDFYFEPIQKGDSCVCFRVQNGEQILSIEYKLRPNSYMVDIETRAEHMQDLFTPTQQYLTIDWRDHILQQEKGYDFENRYSALTYKKSNAGTDNLKETSDDTEEPEKPLEWIAFKNQFFSAVLIAPNDFSFSSLKSTQEKEKKNGYLKNYEAQLQTPFESSGKTLSAKLQMYIGPNDFHVLKKHNKLCLNEEKKLELEELVDLGWPLFRWINRWLILPLFNMLNGFGMNMGLVLLLLTIIVKTLVYPTQKKSYVSSAKMRVLKPQVDALSLKYPNKEDAMKKQQEMMQLYSQYGVSPMGGCLPALIQAPIWIALFNFVPNAIELRGESFLWADDLSAYDELLSWGKDLWMIGDHLSIFCVLFCITNIINTWISMRQQQNQMSGEQAQQMKMMQYMMYFMPLMFFFMFNNYSSGLCYYYFVSGLLNILTMWYLRRTTDDQKLLEKLEAYKAAHKNDAKKPTGMAARLEALQKMQEEQARQRRK